MIVDHLVDSSYRRGFSWLWTEIEVDNRDVLVIKPTTYMNRSGVALKQFARRFEMKPQEMLVVYDDMDLPLGRLRVRSGGSSGGHRGVESISTQLGSSEFARLRIGIGRPLAGQSAPEYVLSPFSKDEKELVGEVISTAAGAVKKVVNEGISEAMNMYNGLDFRSLNE